MRRLLGTPTDATWPGVSSLPDYKPTFPQWAARPLAEAASTLDPVGMDLLAVSATGVALTRQKMLIYEPSRRISAKAALSHPYFDDLDKSSMPQ